MRVVIATGGFRNLGSTRTGTALARAWAQLGCSCAVVPIAEAGEGFAAAWRDLDAPGTVVSLQGHTDATTSRGVGELVAAELVASPGDLRLVLPRGAAVAWHDGGAGFLAALGATADRPLDAGPEGLRGVGRLDLSDAARRLGGRRVHLVTDRDQSQAELTGLRGITSLARDSRPWTPQQMLDVDQALLDLSGAAGVGGSVPGSGAAGGLGLAIRALGGEVVCAPDACAREAGLVETVRQADLVVTGCDQLDFGSMGADLVPVVTGLAQQALRPVVAVARRNYISAREVRAMGIEEAYGLARDEHDLTMDELTVAAHAVARTWYWERG